jgi:hypothetical protein
MSAPSLSLTCYALHQADDNSLYRLLDQTRAELPAATSKYGRQRASNYLRRVAQELRKRGLPAGEPCGLIPVRVVP